MSKKKSGPEGGVGLPGIVAGIVTIAVAVMAIALVSGAHSTFPTWRALTEAGPGRPIDVSTNGKLSDWLFDATTWGVTSLFVIMVGILVWASLNHREDHKAHYETGEGRGHLILTAVISSAIFFGIDVALLLYHSFLDLHSDQNQAADTERGFWNFPTADDHPLTVEVMAQQWAWNFRYPGPDGKFGKLDPKQISASTGNPLGIDASDPAGKDDIVVPTLTVPVNREIDLLIRSQDVIHNFFVRELRLQQDAVPGLVVPLHFTATKTGHYEIVCTQLCGLGHYRMRSFMDVVTDSEYQNFLKQQEQPAGQ